MIPRDAAEADLPVLARILGDWAADTPWMPRLHSRKDDLGFLRRLYHSGCLRVIGDAPQGFLARQDAEIPALFVAAPARRQGAGKALIRDAMAAAPVLQLWTFQANVAARSLYFSVGFVEIERTDRSGNEERLPDVRLEWRR